MKTLKTIQLLAKIGAILSKIIFVFCIVGFCFNVIGIIGLAVGLSDVRIGDVTLKSLIENEAGLSLGALYAELAVGAIVTATEAVLSKFAAHYFDREQADGTPFTLGGAKELMRHGILTICLSLGAEILAHIVHGILARSMTGVGPLETGTSSSVAFGVMMLIVALICRYGAEREENRDGIA